MTSKCDVSCFIGCTYIRCVMSEKSPEKKKLSPNLSKQPLVTTMKKYISCSSLVKNYDIFTVDNITFICFRYALYSLLGIK